MYLLSIFWCIKAEQKLDTKTTHLAMIKVKKITNNPFLVNLFPEEFSARQKHTHIEIRWQLVWWHLWCFHITWNFLLSNYNDIITMQAKPLSYHKWELYISMNFERNIIIKCKQASLHSYSNIKSGKRKCQLNIK